MKKLELKFYNDDERTVTYSLEKPVEPADPEAIKAAMEEIITQDAFTSSGGDIATIKEARIVERNVETIELD